MNKMGNKNKGVIVIFIAVLLLSVVLCYLFATNKISIGNKNLNDQNTSSDKNNNKNENNVKPKDNIKDEKAYYIPMKVVIIMQQKVILKF